MIIKGIKKRWIINSLGFTISIFTILVIIFSMVVRGYFYSGIQQTIRGRTNELYEILRGRTLKKNSDFVDVAKVYVENFSDNKIMEIMIFDEDNNVAVTSSGFLPEMREIMPDYDKAKENKDGVGTWEGKSHQGERLMAVTRCIYDGSHRFLGAVRYVVSLEEANYRVVLSTIMILV